MEKVLFDENAIAKRVRELGREVSLWARGGDGKFALLWLAEGAFVFAADLARSIDGDVDFSITSLKVSSYGNALSPETAPKFSADFSKFKDMRVLLVDDIVDSGATADAVTKALVSAGAKEVKTCFFLRKVRENSVPKADFWCFDIPDVFVYGYGLDIHNRRRHLPQLFAHF